jgi:hypothetical protein
MDDTSLSIIQHTVLRTAKLLVSFSEMYLMLHSPQANMRLLIRLHQLPTIHHTPASYKNSLQLQALQRRHQTACHVQIAAVRAQPTWPYACYNIHICHIGQGFVETDTGTFFSRGGGWLGASWLRSMPPWVGALGLAGGLLQSL